LKVFVGVPNLATDDVYEEYLPYVLTYLSQQETSVTIMKPYITPPHDGVLLNREEKLKALAGRMNNIVEKFLSTDATHVFFLDGDVEIPSNTIETLINHNVDVVSGVYPWHDFDKSQAMMFGRMSKTSPCGNLRPRIWGYLKGRVVGSTEEPWSGGTGCLLASRRVFENIRFIKTDECGFDVLFWKHVYDAGFSARVDANIVCGHLPNFPLINIADWLYSIEEEE